MQRRCPACGRQTVIAQDVEEMSNSVALVKMTNRIQLSCTECGWIGFEDEPLD